MKIALSLLAGATLMLVAATADAQKSANMDIDFGAMSCQHFIHEVSTGSEDDIGALFLWLDGYLSGVSGDTVLSFTGLEALAGSLVEYCQHNGRVSLLDAARYVGIEY